MSCSQTQKTDMQHSLNAQNFIFNLNSEFVFFVYLLINYLFFCLHELHYTNVINARFVYDDNQQHDDIKYSIKIKILRFVLPTIQCSRCLYILVYILILYYKNILPLNGSNHINNIYIFNTKTTIL